MAGHLADEMEAEWRQQGNIKIQRWRRPQPAFHERGAVLKQCGIPGE